MSLPKIFTSELSRYIQYFWQARYHRNIFLLIIFLSAIFYSVYKKKNYSRYLLAIVGGIILFFTFFVNHKSTFYLIYILPFLFILVGSWCRDIFNKNRFQGYFLITLLLGFELIQLLFIAVYFRRTSFSEYANSVKKLLPEKAVILSTAPLWLAFREHEFYSDFYFWPFWWKGDIEESFKTTIDKIGADYLIIDEDFAWFFPEKRKREMQEYLQSNCRLLAGIENEFYGAGYSVVPAKHLTRVYWRRRK